MKTVNLLALSIIVMLTACVRTPKSTPSPYFINGAPEGPTVIVQYGTQNDKVVGGVEGIKELGNGCIGYQVVVKGEMETRVRCGTYGLIVRKK